MWTKIRSYLIEVRGMRTIEQPSNILLTQEEMRGLIEKAQAGDIDARKQMIEGNTRLVWSIVQRFASLGSRA